MENDVKFINNTKKVLSEFDKAINRALGEIGMQAEGYAKDLAPYDTGFLRNSITYAIGGEKPKISSYKADKADKNGEIKKGKYSGVADNEKNTVYIGTNVSYARRKEFGYKKETANPYLKPAIANHIQTYKNIVEDELKNG